jgi:hypothetical protein
MAYALAITFNFWDNTKAERYVEERRFSAA